MNEQATNGVKAHAMLHGQAATPQGKVGGGAVEDFRGRTCFVVEDNVIPSLP
jgi:hypothetical protein